LDQQADQRWLLQARRPRRQPGSRSALVTASSSGPPMPAPRQTPDRHGTPGNHPDLAKLWNAAPAGQHLERAADIGRHCRHAASQNSWPMPRQKALKPAVRRTPCFRKPDRHPSRYQHPARRLEHRAGTICICREHVDGPAEQGIERVGKHFHHIACSIKPLELRPRQRRGDRELFAITQVVGRDHERSRLGQFGDAGDLQPEHPAHNQSVERVEGQSERRQQGARRGERAFGNRSPSRAL
jgi:hypothetical protein